MQEGLHKIVSSDETIVAISTPVGHSGLGVIRISGRDCKNLARHHFKAHSNNLDLQHRTAVVGVWRDATGEEIDEVVVTYFGAPRSYTGEDVLEIGAHGNPMVLRRIVESTRPLARQAAPGEFTLRAVANGKMDLVQAEAVREFIDAQTERQAKTALKQAAGSLSKHLKPLKGQLLDEIALLEAGIDFAEDDVTVPANETVITAIRPLIIHLRALQESFDYGRILTEGLRLAVLGKPNVGKSSLFNRLVGQDRAIVADIPGTTRDVVKEVISLDGVPLCFADTAGMRKTTDVVEQQGVARALETLSDSDFALVVFDGARSLDEDDREALAEVSRTPHLCVINKSDLPQAFDVGALNGSDKVFVSAKTGEGMDVLHRALQAFLLSRKAALDDDLILRNSRQHDAVSRSADALIAADRALKTGIPHEMVLLDLYRALAALDELTGDSVTDDILDRVFSRFCIGK